MKPVEAKSRDTRLSNLLGAWGYHLGDWFPHWMLCRAFVGRVDRAGAVLERNGWKFFIDPVPHWAKVRTA